MQTEERATTSVEGFYTVPPRLSRTFHTLWHGAPTWRRLGDTVRPKPVGNRRSSLSTFRAECEISGLEPMIWPQFIGQTFHATALACLLGLGSLTLGAAPFPASADSVILKGRPALSSAAGAAPSLFADSVGATVSQSPAQGVRRERTARMRRSALVAACRPGSKLRLDLFDGESVEVRFHEACKTADRLSLIGTLDEQPQSSVILVWQGQAVAGCILTEDGRAFRLRPGPDGAVLLQEEDPDKELPCGGAVTPSPDEPSGKGKQSKGDAPTAQDGPSTPAVLDVLVVYTPAARMAAGGHDAMQALIRVGMEKGNIAFANSLIAARLRLVHMQEINFTEPAQTSHLDNELAWLRAPADGVMDEVHALRLAHGADQVTLVIKDYASKAAGRGYLRGSLDGDFSGNAFTVVRLDYADQPTVAHEIGHNLGCAHDRANAGRGGLFSYSLGWRFGGLNGWEYRTVMAYEPGLRVLHFSNPDVTYRGVPTGVPIGEPEEAHNAQSINLSVPSAQN